METRTLGSTGLIISPIGLGLAALGRPGYINLGHAGDLDQNYDVATMQSHAHAVLDAARQAGIRYFDAARSYGRAEQFLGAWLLARNIAPEAVTVGSKWGYTYTAGWQVEADFHEVKEHSLAVLQRQLTESRQQLGQHLDLYQIHSATLDSGVLENKEVLAELARRRSQEDLKIGLTLSGEAQAETLRRALDVHFEGELLFDAVQATWNLLEPSAGEVLRQAHETGMGVIIKEALANGRLTPRNNDPAFQPKLALLQEIAATHHVTMDALALAAVLAQPWVDVVLSGAATVEHISSNVAALEVRWDETTDRRLRSLAETPAQYWQTRSQLAWN